MASNTASIIGFIVGGIWLSLALFSTRSKVTLSLFGPWLFREVRYQQKPILFIGLVLFYSLLGLSGIAFGIANIWKAH